MGLFNFTKKKKPDTTDNQTRTPNKSLPFRKEYIWGFTQGNPMRHGGDKTDFYKLIKPLTGVNGSITIGASFHPYQIIDKNGVDLWDTLYSVIKANNFCDYDDLISNKDFFHMAPPGPQAFPINVWTDERLLTDNNPAFEKFVPFIIPYLTHDNGQNPEWLNQINIGINQNGNAQEFITKVNNDSRFLMPEPTFIIGFGEFNNSEPESLIGNFVDFMEKNLKGK
jgi:hypothetical protein